MSKPAQPARRETVSPMLAALRAGTREHHLVLERHLNLPGRIRERADLAAVLAALLASWAPVERQLAAADWSGLGLDPRLGEAAGLLRADLATLDADPADAVASADPPGVRFDSPARALGGRYVLLGSALGGSVIAPAVERLLGLPEGTATGFFRRSGRVPGRDWRDFRRAVAARDWSTEELREATEAARDTFTFVGRAAAPILGDRDADPAAA
ncbi:biliverdin-producing heme oxygenase [Micromonospora soli]|uniref:biliverdin-producing heme oxygenase n=1 Tax=Micromonospora sp. NBRC 110009 TaxID=3061627 RepID=UPI0026735227|nr:biliverdin-producing heme oxygenase [Micromonospora sp. NBRC 110009]WKT96236.1 biliverdin-producing heme oxygenase [Micromonospora sp. NBRC 110009]